MLAWLFPIILNEYQHGHHCYTTCGCCWYFQQSVNRII